MKYLFLTIAIITAVSVVLFLTKRMDQKKTSGELPAPITENGVTYTLIGEDIKVRDYNVDGTESEEVVGYTIVVEATVNGKRKWITSVYNSKSTSRNMSRLITTFKVENNTVIVSGEGTDYVINFETGEVIKGVQMWP